KVRLQQSILELTTESAELFAKKDQLAAQLAEQEQGRAARQGERTAATQSADAMREQLLTRQRKVQAIQLELQQLQQSQAVLVDRIREDYGFDLAVRAAEMAAAPVPEELASTSRDAVEAEIRDLRSRLQAVGPVNLEAL